MFQLALLASLAVSAFSYSLNDSPTLPPIDWEYQIESFVTYLGIEQEGYPEDRTDLTTPAAMTCMSQRLVDLLPGVNTEDIFWTTTATTTTQGIWNHQQTTYFQFDVNFVPQNIIFNGMPNYQYQYDGATPINWRFNDPARADPGVNKGWNGVYKQNENCRDCFPSTDVVYLRFKDIIAEDVTSGKFLTYLEDECPSIFTNTNYAYVSFSESAAVTVGALPARPHHDKHLEYVWFLMFLLVPVAIVLYQKVYQAGAGSFFLSSYDADREAEMAASSNAQAEEQA